MDQAHEQIARPRPAPQPVTFALSANGTGLPTSAAVGSLDPYDPNYLAYPNPPGDNAQSLTVTAQPPGPDAAGNYVFLALLWAPNAMPVPGVPLVQLAITATQQGQTTPALASIALEPPPLLLIHGVWSNAAAAGFLATSPGFNRWIAGRYPHNLIYAVDYGSLSSQAFSYPGIQSRLLSSMSKALAGAAAAGMAARSVDVVAHSMGGLVTRYFLNPAV